MHVINEKARSIPDGFVDVLIAALFGNQFILFNKPFAFVNIPLDFLIGFAAEGKDAAHSDCDDAFLVKHGNHVVVSHKTVIFDLCL